MTFGSVAFASNEILYSRGPEGGFFADGCRLSYGAGAFGTNQVALVCSGEVFSTWLVRYQLDSGITTCDTFELFFDDLIVEQDGAGSCTFDIIAVGE